MVSGSGGESRLVWESGLESPLNHLNIPGTQLAWVYVFYLMAERRVEKVNVILAALNRRYLPVVNRVQDRGSLDQQLLLKSLREQLRQHVVLGP